LKFVFHNPNTPDETAKTLVKAIAENTAKQIIEQKMRVNIKCPKI